MFSANTFRFKINQFNIWKTLSSNCGELDLYFQPFCCVLFLIYSPKRSSRAVTNLATGILRSDWPWWNNQSETCFFGCLSCIAWRIFEILHEWKAFERGTTRMSPFSGPIRIPDTSCQPIRVENSEKLWKRLQACFRRFSAFRFRRNLHFRLRSITWPRKYFRESWLEQKPKNIPFPFFGPGEMDLLF